MTPLRAIRAGKPVFYPDQAIYAQYAADALGLSFVELDGGTGLIFEVSGAGKNAVFGAGRGSFFPQNTATAATLANDKHMANVLMARAGLATLGGAYFFLHDRHRKHRPPGHERSDALGYFAGLGRRAFIKPLNGSRGDFAQVVDGFDAFNTYMTSVERHYDAVVIQPVHRGREYRVFVLDDEIVYSVVKWPPAVTGDGTTSLRDLVAAGQHALECNGISPAGLDPRSTPDVVPQKDEVVRLGGRTNLSAGGCMEFADADEIAPAWGAARAAVTALGLRAGAVDLFMDRDDDAPLRIIEVNANPSIRFLEDAGREDLILRIWRHTFIAMGLIDV